MDANRVTPNQHVVVTKDRITAVGPAAKTPIPAGAVRVEGKGRFVMPGLAEMHGHVPAAPQPKSLIDDVLFLYVANGVTTVRGMLGAPDHLALREAARRGEILAPNLYLAGPSFNGNAAPNPEAAIARVRTQKSERWDLLKVHPGLVARHLRRHGEDGEGSRYSLRRARARRRWRAARARDGAGHDRSRRRLRRVSRRPRRSRSAKRVCRIWCAHEEGGNRHRPDVVRVGNAAGAGHPGVSYRAARAALPAQGDGGAVDEGARRA